MLGYVTPLGEQCVMWLDDGERRVSMYDAAGNPLLTFKPSETGFSGTWNYDAMTADAAGRIYLAGHDGTGGMFVSKYDAAGVRQWTSTYGSGAKTEGGARGIAVDGAGAIYVAGYTVLYDAPTSTVGATAYLTSFDANGSLAWARTVTSFKPGFGADVVLDGAGSVFLIGGSYFSTYDGTWLAKFTTTGTPIYTRTVSANGPGTPRRTAAWYPSSNSVMIGMESVDGLGVVSVDGNTGIVQGSGKVYLGPANFPRVTDIAAGPGGEVALAALAQISGATGFLFARFPPGLSSTAWLLVEPFPSHGDHLESSPAIGFDPAGNMLIQKQGGGVSSTDWCAPPADVELRKVDSAGGEIWTRLMDGSPTEIAVGVAGDGASGALVATDGGNYNTLRRYDATGALLWERDLALPDVCQMHAVALVRSGAWAYTVCRGSAVSGALAGILVQRHDLDGNGGDWVRVTAPSGMRPSCAAVDGAGNVYIGGIRYSSTWPDDEILAAKVDSAGVVQWVQTTPRDAFAATIACIPDGAGGVLIAQSDGEIPGGTRRRLARFGSDGSLVWSRSIAGNRFLWGAGTRIDSHLYLVGADDVGHALIERRDLEGALIWSQTAGPAMNSGDNVLYSVAPDSTGNLLSVGGSYFSTSLHPAGIRALSFDQSGNIRWTLTSSAGTPANYGWAVAPGSPLFCGRSNNDAYLQQFTEIAGPPASLDAAIAIEPEEALLGSLVRVVLTVTNTGAGAAIGVTATVSVGSGGGGVDQIGSLAPAGPVEIAAGATQRFTWTYSVTALGGVSFSVTLSGIDTGPFIPTSLTRAKSLKPRLVVSASAPASVSIGQWFDATLTLINGTGSSLTDITADHWTVPAGGEIALLAGPSPAGPTTIPGGGTQPFTWTFSASGAGALELTLTATGIESGTGLPLSWSRTLTVLVQAPATVGVSIAIEPVVLRQGELISVTVFVTNGGGALLVSVTPWIEWGPAAPPPVIVVSAPTSGGAIAGGGVGSHAWRLRALRSGVVSFTASATGADGNTGVRMTGTAPLPWTVTVTPAAVLAGFVVATPSTLRVGGTLVLRFTVSNSGDSPAADLTPSLTFSDWSAGNVVAGPSPGPGGLLGSGLVVDYTWQVEARKAGRLQLLASLVGVDGTVYVSSQSLAAVEITPGIDAVIAAYPNPVTGDTMALHLQLEGDAERVELEVFNSAFVQVAGVTWVAVPRLAGPLGIEGISAWAPGPYLFRVTARLVGGNIQSFPLHRVMVIR